MHRANDFRIPTEPRRVITYKNKARRLGMQLSRGTKWLVRTWLTVALLGAAASAWPQMPDGAGVGTTLEFDVASVRPSRADAENTKSNVPLGPGDVYAATGGTLAASNFRLVDYINFAYRINANQGGALRKHLPDWAINERYDITAKTDKHDVTKDEMRLMMRALLAERFHLQIHSEDEEQSVYALELIKPQAPRPKLQQHPDGQTCAHTPQEADPSKPRPSLYAGEAVYPVFCGGVMGNDGKTPGTIALAARDVSLGLIASTIAGPAGLDRPIVDRTGLTGKYDFLLEFAPERGSQPGDSGASPLDVAGPGIAQALNEQLGMRLVPQKAPVQVWVVDHIEHVSEN
jgi:uncharacterized protein (TIGR03435 family)